VQARKNIELMKNYGIRRIVTACAHCFNTIKNEYPQFGGDFEVIHHTEFLADLLKDDKLRVIQGRAGVLTYHDPCCLGRYNDIYEPPRQVLNSLPEASLTEMRLNRKNSFCCGGCAHMWLEERIGERISALRIEQALETKAVTIASSCPFCLLMIDDAIKSKKAEELLEVKDISELTAESAVYHPYLSQ
jgi:Fe-S oxidoreductase